MKIANILHSILIYNKYSFVNNNIWGSKKVWGFEKRTHMQGDFKDSCNMKISKYSKTNYLMPYLK